MGRNLQQTNAVNCNFVHKFGICIFLLVLKYCADCYNVLDTYRPLSVLDDNFLVMFMELSDFHSQ